MDGNDYRIQELRERLTEVIAGAPELTEILRGTVRTRYVRCGKEGCHCQDGEGHGPVYYLSVTLSTGRTKQITLGKDTYDLATQYVQNFQRLREILEEVSTINREILAEKRRTRRRRRGP
jgi:hypothetical protein